jgi:hypothetical protein
MTGNQSPARVAGERMLRQRVGLNLCGFTHDKPPECLFRDMRHLAFS